jgi:hypothetical protein
VHQLVADPGIADVRYCFALFLDPIHLPERYKTTGKRYRAETKRPVCDDVYKKTYTSTRQCRAQTEPRHEGSASMEEHGVTSASSDRLPGCALPTASTNISAAMAQTIWATDGGGPIDGFSVRKRKQSHESTNEHDEKENGFAVADDDVTRQNESLKFKDSEAECSSNLEGPTKKKAKLGTFTNCPTLRFSFVIYLFFCSERTIMACGR